MLNVVALMGRLVADPELRHTPNGVATCTFRIAVDRSFVRAGEERKADFIDIVVWRQTAEFVCKYFHKGNPMRLRSLRTTSTLPAKRAAAPAARAATARPRPCRLPPRVPRPQSPSAMRPAAPTISP